ncbi:GNAT family N-acetyltransferase [Aneurinibacillus sp. REN35]|uniref:GNAT family N-acetyltransferase n=1 Tax=Aneurinibacillus sp. REN35 TaxID=3237286 RepID=UPI003528D0F7
MHVHELSPTIFGRTRDKFIRFAHHHGSRRITGQAIRWLREVPEDMFMQQGNIILAAIQNKKLLGLLAVCEYGITESFLIVHKDARRNGVGSLLTAEGIKRMGKLYVRVAADNEPSLKTCFAVGMVAFACFRGVTDKPTLWLAAGDWSREDVGSI